MPLQATTERRLSGASAPPAFLTPAGADSRLAGRKVLALVAATICVYFYLQTFVLPAVPVLQRDDQVTFIVNAARMLRGEMIYSDFFQYTPPGTDLVYLGLFKTFGVRAWIASAVIVWLGMAVFFVCYAIAAQVMPRTSACLTSAVFSVFVFGAMANGTHHWYSALLIMCAAWWVLARRTPARLAGSGVAVALASFFTQTRVVSLVALALFVVWEQRRKHQDWLNTLKREAGLVLGFGGAFLLLNVYYLRHAGPGRIFQDQVVALGHAAFTLKSYVLGFPSIPPWYLIARAGGFLMVYLLVPAIYIYIFVRFLRQRRQDYSAQDERILLLALIGTTLFLEVLAAPNWVRLFPISMPAVILAAHYVAGEETTQLYLRRSLWAATIMVGLLCAISAQVRPHRTLNLPIGRAVVYDKNTSAKLEGLALRTRPGDYFFEAAWLDLYFPLQLRNPSYVEALSPSSTPEQVQDVVEALERHRVKYVLWSARLDASNAGSAGGNVLQPVLTYLRNHYRVVARFSPAEDLWERSTEPSR